ncbi:MAG: UDP-glucose 4-epimerase GalE [Fibrobacterota bacterium]
MKKEKILVTGGAGYIGSHMSRMLAERGFDVVVFDSLERSSKKFLNYGSFFQGDLRNKKDVAAVFSEYPGISAVFHFAAFMDVGESVKKPDLYFENNIGGTSNLVDEMELRGVNNLIFSSTCAVYGIPSRIPIEENFPLSPVNPYGVSKKEAEKRIMSTAQNGNLNYVIFRYFNVAGADPSGEIGEEHNPETHLIPLCFKASSSGGFELSVFGEDYETGDGTCIRDYIHVNDLCEAHLKGFDYLKSGGEPDIFNLGNSRGFSVMEIIENIEKITGRKVRWKGAPRREGDPPELVGSYEKARRKLGWTPFYDDIAPIISSAVNYYQKSDSGS